MPFDPKTYRNSKDGIGSPADDAAVNTTDPNTLVALFKAVLGKLGGGTATVIASDVAQGSTTAGQTGGLQQGAVTTAAPTYTTGKTNPLSLKTNGDLRVADTDAAALLTTIDSKLGDLKGYTDGLETLATTLNTYVDGLETLVGATNTLLTTQAGYVDGLETLNGAVTETAPATDTASSGLNGRLQRIAQRLTSLIALVPASLGQKAMASSFAVALASDDPLTVLQSASSASVTSLASAATSAQLLAANAARKGLILNNTDANAVLVKYGTTASATSYTVRITQNGYWEMPRPIYTGRIDAIWEADGSGSLYATEL